MKAATVSGPSRRIASSSARAAAGPPSRRAWRPRSGRDSGRDVEEAGHARLEHLPVGRHAGGAHRLQRDAVVGLLARDDLDLVGLALRLPVEARRLERRLVRLGAAAGEEDGLHVRVGERRRAWRPAAIAGMFDGAGVGREVGELLICSAAASASSSRPWPTLTFQRPDSPSMYSRPWMSLIVAPRPRT